MAEFKSASPPAASKPAAKAVCRQRPAAAPGAAKAHPAPAPACGRRSGAGSFVIDARRSARMSRCAREGKNARHRSVDFARALNANGGAVAPDECEEQRMQYPKDWNNVSKEKPLFDCSSHYSGALRAARSIKAHS